MSSDEDGELAELRRARLARLGAGGLTISSMRNQLASRGRQDEVEDDDGPQIVEEEEEGNAMALPPSLGLPTSFGSTAAAARDLQKASAPARHAGPPGPRKPAAFQPPAAAEHSGSKEEEEEDVVGPLRPPEPGGNVAVDDAEDATGGAGEGESDEEEEDAYKLPITQEVTLEGQGKVVSALDLDHSGSRLLSGSYDYTLRIFDFNGMKSDLRSFRNLEPTEGHPIMALSWSPTGDVFLVVTGSPQPKVYTRDGKEEGEFVRGDMYIRDMKNTKGHVSGCTGGMWHPTDKGTAMTCSDDGTIRLWDMWELNQRTVIKPQLAKPGRVAVTACCFSTDGRLIAGGLMDGTIQLWDIKGQSGQFGRSAAVGVVLPPKPQMKLQQKWSYVSNAGQLLRGAHVAGNEITCLAFSRDGNTLLSRGADDTLKVWDVRKFKSPLASFEGLPNAFSTTQCCFDPSEELIVTGLSAPKDSPTGGGLAFFDRQRLQLVRRVGTKGSAVAVHWHPAINQILVGCGDRKSGAVHVLYDPQLSSRGALLSVRRAPRAANPFDFQAPLIIYNPNALPMYRDAAWPGGGRKRKAEWEAEQAAQALRTRKPDLGSTAVPGKGAGGKLGTSGGTLLTQYLLKNKGALHNPAEEDVRAAILRHAGKEDEFSRFTAAYAATQPERIYAKDEPEEGEDEEGGQ